MAVASLSPFSQNFMGIPFFKKLQSDWLGEILLEADWWSTLSCDKNLKIL